MIEICNINIARLKQKLAKFEIHKREIGDVRVFRFSAGGHNYEFKMNFIPINFDGKNFVGANTSNESWGDIEKALE